MMHPPIDVLPLFPRLNRLLLSFLEQLKPGDWQQQTVASAWVVKDVAAHLLDGNYRRISLHRDGWLPVPSDPVNSHKDLVDYLNSLNADWVKAAKRLSPSLLVQLLEHSNQLVYDLFKKMDPFAEAAFAVGWAGENRSYNWFDIAREYTERWLHQQQIRDALEDQTLMTKELYYPVLDIFMRAWPHAAKDRKADEGTMLKTTITGEGGGEWFLLYSGGHWKLSEIGNNMMAAETIIPGAIAWKLFSKSIRKAQVEKEIRISGNEQLGNIILDMVSVMA